MAIGITTEGAEPTQTINQQIEKIRQNMREQILAGDSLGQTY